MKNTWVCWNCNSGKELQETEICECGCALELDDPNELLYELEDVMEKIESLTRKAQNITKKIRTKNRK